MNQVIKKLLSNQQATFLIGVGNEADCYTIRYILDKKINKNFVTRIFRGKKLSTYDGLLDEISASLQFPDYFGENWDALEECMSDLDWLDETDGYILIFTNSDKILQDERLSVFGTFIDILDKTAKYWQGQGKDFYALFQVSESNKDNFQKKLQEYIKDVDLFYISNTQEIMSYLDETH